MFSFSSAPKVSKEEALKEQMRKWQSDLRAQMREIDRQIRAVERETEKVKREAQTAGKKGETSVVKMLAHQIVKARAATARMLVSKAHINSISMSLQMQASTARVAGVMGKSADMMKAFAKLINAPEIGAVMRNMSMEMQKAGVIEEIMSDTMEGVAGADEEEEADEVVQQVMYEVTHGIMGAAPSVPVAGLPTGTRTTTGAAAAATATSRVAVGMGGSAAASSRPPHDGSASGGPADMSDLAGRLDRI